MAIEVPTRSRLIVREREQGRCLRCSGRGTQWCHRRRRNVVDEHQHCPCNGWLGCHTCHQVWQHANPDEAGLEGFALSQFVTDPSTIPVQSWYGAIYLHCNGDIDIYTGEEKDNGVHD